MTKLTGGECLVRALADAGVRVVFGIPGVHNLPIYDALLAEPRITHILARHEQGAAFMADGYARATGESGVVITTSGPGALNALTPLATAYADFSPVLCVSSQIESYYIQNGHAPFRGVLHEMKDQFGAMSAATGWSTRPSTASAIAGAVRRALHHLQSYRPTPAYIEVPFDVLSGQAEYVDASTPPRAALGVDRDRMARFAEILRDAERPLVIAGGAVISANASQLLTELAERLGAPVLVSALAKGCISEDHPLALGRVWRRDTAPINQVIEESDVVLVVGSLLRGKETDEWAMPLRGRILQIDPDIEQIGLNYPIELGAVADPALALDTLLDQLSDTSPRVNGEARARRGREGTLSLLREERGDLLDYLDAIRSALPADGMLCGDMTMLAYASETYYPVLRPRTFMTPKGFGTLGFGLPAAIGAKVGRPDVPVVALCGEGGLLFTLQEMATAIQFDVVLSIVVFNDHTYTAVKRVQRNQYGGRYIATDLKDPDLRMLAGAFGLNYGCAQQPAELEQLLRDSFTAHTATLVEAPIQVENW